MKNQTNLNYTAIIFILGIFFTTNLFATMSACDYYNQQYDKYEYLASITPDVDAKKRHYIDKIDFYDMQIFHDDSCDLRRTTNNINTYDFVDELFE